MVVIIVKPELERLKIDNKQKIVVEKLKIKRKFKGFEWY